MITLRQLHYLAVLAETRHFGQAAERCHVTQPALSMQIAQLETHLDLVLVERDRRAAHLTPDGEAVLRRARAALAQVGDIEAYARQRQGTLVGRLRLGIIPSVAPFLLPALLPALQASHPRLELAIRETITEALLDQLAHRAIDVALVALPVADPGLASVSLFQDRFLVALRRDDPRAQAGRLAPEAIEDDQLLLLEEGHCLRDQALSYCRSVRPGSLADLGASSLSTIVQLVANGYGITLLPEMATRRPEGRDGIALCRFTAPEPARELGLVWRRGDPRDEDYALLGALIRGVHDGRSDMVA